MLLDSEEYRFKNYKIERNIIDEAIFVDVDSDKIVQVLDNVMNNAIKYSPNGDNITAEFFEREDQLEVVFTNWGIRPLDNEISKIKERGFRSERVIKETTIEGSGLGLYLLEQICDSNDVELRILIGNGSKRVNIDSF